MFKNYFKESEMKCEKCGGSLNLESLDDFDVDVDKNIVWVNYGCENDCDGHTRVTYMCSGIEFVE